MKTRITPSGGSARRATLGILGAVVGSVLLVVPGAAPAAAYPTSTVTITGHGYGHGRGMGQYGALGYALAGQPYTQILDHYYSNTTMGSAAGTINVDLTRLDGSFAIVAQEKKLATINGAASPHVYFMAQMIGPNTFQLYTGDGSCGGPWAASGNAVTGPIVFSSPNAGDDHTTMLQTCEGAGNHWYRGDLVASDGGSGACAGAGACKPRQRTLNRLPLDSYVRGVVPRESPSSWGALGGGAGENALRAQAVAARSYGWARQQAGGQICDTDACQVFGGFAVQDAGGYRELEASTTNQAVTDTAGQVRVFSNGAVASTEFSSSTGGYTAGGAFPAVVDDGDATPSNPNHTWTVSLAVSAIEGAYPSVGTLQGIDVTSRNGLGDLGGRVNQLVVRGTNGSVNVTGEQFRSRFGLKSNWFAVTNSPSGGIDGYWIVAPDGGMFSFGNAAFFGSMGGKHLNQPIVGMAATPSGNGYWQVASDGGMFSFGDARFFGSMGGKHLNQPIVGMAATPSGNGYWQVASDGGMFSFGDARFFGSMGGKHLNQPIVGMAATPSGNGYWLVAADGGIFSFGDGAFHGSTGAMHLVRPVVGMAATAAGDGYWLVAADGGLFAFNSPYYGSLPGSHAGDTAVAMRPTRTGRGYEIVAQSGRVYPFGDAPYLGDVATALPGYHGGVRGMDLHNGG